MGRGQMQKYVEVSGIGIHDIKSKKESMKVKKKKNQNPYAPSSPTDMFLTVRFPINTSVK